jgi:hypothetical protein
MFAYLKSETKSETETTIISGNNYQIRKKDMNLTKHLSVISGAFFGLATFANAQSFTGTIGIQEDSNQTGSFTSSSLTMDVDNFTDPGSGSGTFGTGNIPNGTEAFAYSTAIMGLSSTPETVNIGDFLQIGGPGPALFASPGTTPNNRFDFELQTLAETSSSPTAADFIGMGVLTDTTGVFAPTSAELELSFSGVNNYSFTLQAVPEPTTLVLLGAGLFGTFAFRRRKN